MGHAEPLASEAIMRIQPLLTAAGLIVCVGAAAVLLSSWPEATAVKPAQPAGTNTFIPSGAGGLYSVDNQQAIEFTWNRDEVLFEYLARPYGSFTRFHHEPALDGIITAVSIIPGTGLYLAILDNDTIRTRIERWVVTVTGPPNPFGMVVNRAVILESSMLTTVRSFATTPNANAMIMIHDESDSLLRVDLSSGSQTVLLDSVNEPSLVYKNYIAYRSHATHGSAFIVSELPDNSMKPVRPYSAASILILALWDANSDATPESVSALTNDAWLSQYSPNGDWFPYNLPDNFPWYTD